MTLSTFRRIILVSRACAVELFVWMGVCVYRWPNSSSILCIDKAWPLLRRTLPPLLFAIWWVPHHCWLGFPLVLPWACVRWLGCKLLVWTDRRCCCGLQVPCCWLCMQELRALGLLGSQGIGGISPWLLLVGWLVRMWGHWEGWALSHWLLMPKIRILLSLLGWTYSLLCLVMVFCWLVSQIVLLRRMTSWCWGVDGPVGFGMGVLESMSGLLDEHWHQEVDLALFVDPFYGETKILFLVPIAQIPVICSYCIQQVLCILLC